MLYAGLPILHISASAEKRKTKDIIFECPVYRAPKRTGLNFVTGVDLKSEDPAQKWVLRGVALLTVTD